MTPRQGRERRPSGSISSCWCSGSSASAGRTRSTTRGSPAGTPAGTAVRHHRVPDHRLEVDVAVLDLVLPSASSSPTSCGGRDDRRERNSSGSARRRSRRRVQAPHAGAGRRAADRTGDEDALDDGLHPQGEEQRAALLDADDVGAEVARRTGLTLELVHRPGSPAHELGVKHQRGPGSSRDMAFTWGRNVRASRTDADRRARLPAAGPPPKPAAPGAPGPVSRGPAPRVPRSRRQRAPGRGSGRTSRSRGPGPVDGDVADDHRHSPPGTPDR